MGFHNHEHSITNFLEVPDYVTLAGMLCGLTSIFASLEGHLAFATGLMAVALACDFFDGWIARRMGREGRFGVELDGFADILTPVVGVVVFGYCAGLDTPLAIASMIVFCAAGALRLSRFAITGTVDGYYEGLPVTCGALIPAAYWLCTLLGASIAWMPILYLLPALLMISTIRVKKPAPTFPGRRL